MLAGVVLSVAIHGARWAFMVAVLALLQAVLSIGGRWQLGR